MTRIGRIKERPHVVSDRPQAWGGNDASAVVDSPRDRRERSCRLYEIGVHLGHECAGTCRPHIVNAFAKAKVSDALSESEPE
jgi:hypothetical protein